MKYIGFEIDNETHENRPLYNVKNIRSGDYIAQIFWYSSWRKWCVRFNEDSVWSEDCLADVRNTLLKLGCGISPFDSQTAPLQSAEPDLLNR